MAVDSVKNLDSQHLLRVFIFIGRNFALKFYKNESDSHNDSDVSDCNLSNGTGDGRYYGDPTVAGDSYTSA